MTYGGGDQLDEVFADKINIETGPSGEKQPALMTLIQVDRRGLKHVQCR